jgi:hypothetical protein
MVQVVFTFEVAKEKQEEFLSFVKSGKSRGGSPMDALLITRSTSQEKTLLQNDGVFEFDTLYVACCWVVHSCWRWFYAFFE